MSRLLGMALSFLLGGSLLAGGARRWPLEINGVLFDGIELALDDQERSRGLMGRSALDQGGGMLFVFPKAETAAFWMKDTRIPLDIVFLDEDDRIVALHAMPAEPPRQPYEDQAAYERRLPLYGSAVPARSALELKSGMIRFLRLRKGMRIPLNRDALPWPVR